MSECVPLVVRQLHTVRKQLELIHHMHHCVAEIDEAIQHVVRAGPSYDHVSHKPCLETGRADRRWLDWSLFGKQIFGCQKIANM